MEKRANGKADELAKAGAALHGVTAAAAHLWAGLADIAVEVGRWAGQLHSHVADQGPPDRED
eukprot:6722525-Pyramimonas_sp.AAC.1